MSSTDSRTQDPAKSHPSENMGHEMSDFSWTSVMWLIPLSVIVLATFTIGSMYLFKGAKDSELADKQAVGPDSREIQILRAKENEVLTSYKWLDKTGGRAQIPVARAMELLVKENEGTPGLAYQPITELYTRAELFARAPQHGKAGNAAATSQKASGEIAAPSAPGGGAASKVQPKSQHK